MILDIRLLPHAVSAGSSNMAMDETLLQGAVRGIASFRTYCWSEPTVSLGYFQAHACRSQRPPLAPLPFVRRPTGGLTLVHHHELTYALALPAEYAGPRSSLWLGRVHEVVASALRDFGVSCCIAGENGTRSDDILCFHHVTAGDLLAGRHKIAGSAQRRRRGALLQHGALLLGACPFTPSVPGIAELQGKVLSPTELAGALTAQLDRSLNWKMETVPWTSEEIERIKNIERTKYDGKHWNRKR